MSNVIISIKAILNKMLHNEKGASDSILISFIGIGIGVGLMFIVPLMSVSERNDDIAQSVAQVATAEFGDKIAVSGTIKPLDYEEYEQKLIATGNTYEIEIEIQHLDENFGKKNSTTSVEMIGENQRYSTFDALEKMYPEDGEPQNYVLKKGDNVIITFQNTTPTIAKTLRTFAYKVVGKDVPDIAGSYATMVVNNGRSN